jgi:hypothetical protein
MVYFAQAEHWKIPGRMTKAFATEHGAQSEAIGLVTTMLNDSALETVGDWMIDLARVQAMHGADHCYVVIIPLEICHDKGSNKPRGLSLASRWLYG